MVETDFYKTDDGQKLAFSQVIGNKNRKQNNQNYKFLKLMRTPLVKREDFDFEDQKDEIKNEMEEQHKTDW